MIAPGSAIHLHKECSLTKRLFRYAGPIQIWENEKLVIFFKVLEKHKLALWAHTSTSRHGMKLKFGPAMSLVHWWQFKTWTKIFQKLLTQFIYICIYIYRERDRERYRYIYIYIYICIYIYIYIYQKIKETFASNQ